jgi:hypothetical protein
MIVSVLLDHSAPMLEGGSSQEGTALFNVAAGYVLTRVGDTLTIERRHSEEWLEIPWSRVRHSVHRPEDVGAAAGSLPARPAPAPVVGQVPLAGQATKTGALQQGKRK